MNLPQYLVAKHVADPLRMEPRNIGVVLWADGEIRGRFLGENGSRLSPIRPPRRLGITDPKAYERWIRYWREQSEKASLSRSNDGFTATRETPEFLDVLVSKSHLTYMLVRGGFLRKEIPSGQIDEAVSDLFETLVAEDSDRRDEGIERDSELLRRACHKVFAETHLRDRADFEEGLEYLGLAKGIQRTFKFDFALHERFGRKPPQAVLQRVLLSKQTSVYSTAFMFDCLANENHVSRKKCAALVYAPEAELHRSEIRESFDLMRECGQVINTADLDRASEELLAIAG